MRPADRTLNRQTCRPTGSLRVSRSGSEQGVALMTTLLLLALMTVLTIAMVLAVSSDTLINGYYRNFRGAFYAADAGLNVARQDMINQILAVVPPTFTSTTSPIPAGTDASVQTAILSAYGTRKSLNFGSASESWPGSFRITSATLALVPGAGCTPSPCPYTVKSTDALNNPTGYQYIYNYTLISEGKSVSGEQIKLSDQGSLIINATLAPAGGVKTSFSAWGTFYDQYAICSAPLVAGTLTGPVFSNDALTFGSSGPYIFTDPTGSYSPNAGYYFGWGNCVASPTNSYTRSGVTIAPNFQAGFNLGSAKIPLPTNDYDQKRAVLDGKGTGGSNVTPAELSASLRDAGGNAYPATGTTSGVWLPYTVVAGPGCPAPPCFTGGGFYVEGGAQVMMGLPSGGGPGEVWTITQGSNTTTITVNPVANTTTVVSGASPPLTIAGLPMMKDPNTGANVRQATMLYVNGSIPSLSGPGEGIPAVNDGQAITITSAGTVTVTGDILYKTPPVTITQNDPCCPGTPADTLIPGNDKGQVLGIFTFTGDIAMNNLQASGNLEIDASMATISLGGTGGLTNISTWINTLTIIGGRVQNKAKQGNITTRNIYFDRRFSQGGFAPPWFPQTTITAPGTSSATVTSSVQRVKWVNCTAMNLTSDVSACQ